MTVQMERRIRERWAELRPTITIFSRCYNLDPTAELEWRRLRHTRLIITLLSRGIRLRTIRRYYLDDPMQSDDTFDAALVHAVDNLRKSPPRARHGLAKFTRKHVDSTPQVHDTKQGDNACHQPNVKPS